MIFFVWFLLPTLASNIVSFSAGAGRVCVVDSLSQVRCWGQQNALDPALLGVYGTLTNWTQVCPPWNARLCHSRMSSVYTCGVRMCAGNFGGASTALCYIAHPPRHEPSFPPLLRRLLLAR